MSAFISLLGSPSFLRRVLWADALSGAATGALQLAVPGLLATWLGLPAALLTASALAIFVFVGLASFLATREAPPRPLLAALVIGNWAWVAGCLVLAFSGTLAPTALGQGYLVMQAVVVAVLAELQWMGLRQRAVQAAW
jgi:hypothetical protein